MNAIPRPCRPPSNQRNAFTLLEVVLAVALSVFVVASIANAVRLNLVVLQKQRAKIERSQVARNVLVMIKNDLRAAIQYKPADVTGLEELTASQAAIAGIAAGIDPSAVDTSSLDPSLLNQATASASSAAPPSMASQNIGTGGNEPVRPGLYGNSSEILIDISRLPRIDQYNPVVAAGQAVPALPTDIKTVAYFYSPDSLDANLETLANVGLPQIPLGGLYRRELDRAVGAFAYEMGGSMASIAATRLIATEIAEIRFQYFDGENWQAEWDSDEQNGFPAAIEIIVILDSRRVPGKEGALLLNDGTFDNEHMQVYRSVVNLPIAEIMPAEEPSSPAPSSSAPNNAGSGAADPGGGNPANSESGTER